MRSILILAGAAAGGYALLVRGALTLDLGIGRRVRPLGPIARTIAAPPETVFDVIAAPYLGRTPRALAGKLEVWERSSDMALAAHFTQAGRFTTTTVETVRFQRPHRVSFRLLRGPVPHVTETYELARDRQRHRVRLHGRTRHRPLAARRVVGRARGRAVGTRRGRVAGLDPGRGRTPRAARLTRPGQAASRRPSVVSGVGSSRRAVSAGPTRRSRQHQRRSARTTFAT